MKSRCGIDHKQDFDLGLGRYHKTTFNAAVVLLSCILRVKTVQFQLVSLAFLCYVLYHERPMCA